jgi:hypothetical protein
MLTVLCPDSLANDNVLTDDQSQLRSRLRYSRSVKQQSSSDATLRTTPIEHWLAACFELPERFMVSAFKRYLHAAPDSTPDDALTVTPAHLHAGLDHLVLQPPEAIDTTADEALALIDAANVFLKADDISLQMVDPQCWLLKTPKKLDVELSSSAMAIGRNVDIYMPAGKEGQNLRSLLNELQMLWHDHPVNLARENSGQPKINTVWPEGYAGAFRCVTGFERLVSDSAASRGLALAAQIPIATLDATDLTTLTSSDTLLELQSGAPAVIQFLNSQPSLPCDLVLSNAQQWVQLRVSAKDRFCRWRPDPLRL